jgi:hypothetical protein
MIKFWRDKKISIKNKFKRITSTNLLFPSGRQAITFILKSNNLNRNDYIAIPEWSSACVINAVSKICTPITTNFAIKFKIKTKGVVVYDQWGWSNFEINKKELFSNFKNQIIIIDRVDSIYSKEITKNIQPPKNMIKKFYTIYSLSKTIGLRMGALVINNNKFMVYKKDRIKKYFHFNDILKKSNFIDEDLLDIQRTYSNQISFDEQNWLKKNDLLELMNLENKKRRENFLKVFEYKLNKNWEKWMNKKELKTYPNAVPIYFSMKEKKLNQLNVTIRKKFNIESKVYHFNLNASLIKPLYKLAIILPIHGQVRNLDKILTFCNK